MQIRYRAENRIPLEGGYRLIFKRAVVPFPA